MGLGHPDPAFGVLNRIIDPEYRSNLETFVTQLVEPAFDELGWEPTYQLSSQA